MLRHWAHYNFPGVTALAVLLAALSATTAVHAQVASGPIQSPAAQKSAKPSTNIPTAAVKPLWADLSLPQQQALGPLASEWDKLDGTQKQKWLVISKKYSSLQPDQQIRLQERMRDWVKLTPEQRRAARENYSKAKNLDPSRKSAEWELYQQLPEETKQKLAAEAAAKNRVANLPPPTDDKNRITPPKKRISEKAKTTPALPSPPAVPPHSSVPATVPPTGEVAFPSH